MPRFRITVEPLSTPGDTTPLQFEIENHDNIVAIATRLESRFGLDAAATQSLVIGFKLFSEVVLRNRNTSPFSEVRPALRNFEQSLKQNAAPPPTK